MTTTQKWHEATMLGFDTETTGINVHDDRIVTAAVVYRTPGERPSPITWLINPGRPVPDEAAQVHGWTTERIETTLAGAPAVRVHKGTTARMSVDAALNEIAMKLAQAMHLDVPIVAFNAAYDISILEAELARNAVDTLTSRPTGIVGVVDPMVIEKQLDPYRKIKGGCRGGKHKCGGCGAEDKRLTGLCAHYGIVHGGAHDASADAVAAVRLAVKLAGLWPEVARWKLPTLHKNQVAWRAEQMAGLRSYFDKNQIEHDGCCGSWPLHAGCCASVKAVA